jgi:hypothetical protein
MNLKVTKLSEESNSGGAQTTRPSGSPSGLPKNGKSTKNKLNKSEA